MGTAGLAEYAWLYRARIRSHDPEWPNACHGWTKKHVARATLRSESAAWHQLVPLPTLEVYWFSYVDDINLLVISKNIT